LDGQQISLPVLNRENKPIPSSDANSRDISDSIVRAKTKVIGVTRGYGLALYAHDVRPLDFIKGVGVKPDSDLRTVQPRVRAKPSKSGAGPAYVAWADAVAAAKLTDPSFRWDVLTFDGVDEDGVIRPIPYTPAGVGYMVGVKVTYRGVEYTEYLAIMGVLEVQTKKGPKKLDNQPLRNPTSHDWHRAVVRCLTKAIALATGYGLSVYAKEDLADLEMRFLGAPRESAAEAPKEAPKETPVASATVPEAESDAARQSLLAEVQQLLAERGRSADQLLRWLGKSNGTVEDLTEAELQRAKRALMQPATTA
jgi:hypothetical protein